MSTTGDGYWGHLADTERFGRKFSKSDYAVIQLEDSVHSRYDNFTQAGHCMIYSKHTEKIFGIYDPRATVLMQVRFDGYLGFPGGLIDQGESVVSGLNRELQEELNFDVEKFAVKEEDHVISHCNEKEKLLLHFYAVEILLKDFQLVEMKALSAHDYGTEVLGIVRVPLYTMGDRYRGFPAFLTNAFAGNSREQLLQSLIKHKIMTNSEIAKALSANPIE